MGRRAPRRSKAPRIISGGQTGADRGGLDAALDLGLPLDGWCPQGRRAEDGAIPDRYPLRETRTAAYRERTRLNVKWADGTVIFTRGALVGGSKLTAQFAKRLRKPLLHLDLAALSEVEAEKRLRAWMIEEGIGTLNVAGSRESKAAGIGRAVWRVVRRCLERIHGRSAMDVGRRRR